MPVDLPLDVWHLAFLELIKRRAPPTFEIRSDVPIAIEPQRPDMLIVRRKDVARRNDQGLILRRLWPVLGRVTVLEYKSPVEPAFHRGDLLRLVARGVLYETAHLDELPARDDLTLVLVVASITPLLIEEIDRKGWTLVPDGEGYARIEGVMYPCHVVILDEVAVAEEDEYLRLFSHHRARPGPATRWLQRWMRDMTMKQPSAGTVPGYDEMFLKLVEAMPLDKRLAGIAPEQRLAGLTPAQLIQALPIEILRALPGEYVRSLPVEAQEQVKKRLGGGRG